jgi:cytoskeletal protein RodZ
VKHRLTKALTAAFALAALALLGYFASAGTAGALNPFADTTASSTTGSTSTDSTSSSTSASTSSTTSTTTPTTSTTTTPTTTNQPVTIRVHVSDTRGFVVRDALVFARSTPLVTSTPPEQVTNQSGYVTLTAMPRATFPPKPGYHVQFFLRTRKEGESLLAGISSRRLAQVATR